MEEKKQEEEADEEEEDGVISGLQKWEAVSLTSSRSFGTVGTFRAR